MARYQGIPARASTAITVPAVVELHAGDASFLWGIRRKAVKSQKYRLRDLARADERVEAHLEGLEVAGADGWAMLMEDLELGLRGAIFAGGVWTMRLGDEGRFGAVLDSARSDRSSLDALVSGFGWAWSGGTADDRPDLPGLLVGTRTVEPATAAPKTGQAPLETWARKLLLDGEPTSRYVGVGAFAVCRVSPTPGELGQLLTKESDPPTLARAARMIGELGISAAAAQLEYLLGHEVPEVRQAAAWSTALVAPYNRAYLPLLIAAGLDAEPNFDIIEMAGRKLPADQMKGWAQQLSKDGHVRAALVAMAACGAPSLIDDILPHLQDEQTARLAGFAFSQITGADLVKLNLELDEKKAAEGKDEKNGKGAVATATENRTESDIEEDADDEAPSQEEEDDSHLPVPDPDLVAKWWQEHKGEFSAGARYLAGRPVTDPGLRQTLADGTQPQRRAAAVELACLLRGGVVYNTSQPGFVQARDHLGWT